jgi:sec-independent protein translocase protein TatB
LQFMVIAPTIQIANIGMADSLILMVMALVVFGPRRLPQIGRQIGKLMYEFRKASNDFKFQMEEELRNSEEADRRKKEEERLRALALAAPPPAPAENSIAGATAAAESSAAETPNPAANYDNGPVANSQAESIPPTGTPDPDAAPTIRPPSTGNPIEAASPWSLEYELAKAVKPFDAPLNAATKSEELPATAASDAAEPETTTTEPSPPKLTSSEPAQSETTAIEVAASDIGSSEPDRSESEPEAATPPAPIAVNHHG